MYRIFLLVAALAVTSVRAQQGYNHLKAADAFYTKGDYYSAAVYYEKYLAGSKAQLPASNPYVVQQARGNSTGKISSRQQALYRLAESYRQLNDYGKARPYYAQVSADTAAFPLAQYWEGISLRATEKYDSALLVLQQFAGRYTAADTYRENAQREMQNLQFIQLQTAPGRTPGFKVTPAAVNGDGATYAPAYRGNTLVVTSTRPDQGVQLPKQASPYNNRLYAVAGQSLSRLPVPDPGDQQFGAASFTPDGKKMFFTRWVNTNGRNTSAIYTSELKDTAWSEPVLYDAAVNVAGSSARQPFVTADGQTLYYASDKPGGKGGFDLYRIALAPGAQPENLAGVNSAGDDEAPFYTGNRLVFASNGRVGMGNFDLYYSRETAGTFREPVNFGAPVNSVKDDIYFTGKPDGLTGLYLSSDRASACCLQLFTVEALPVPKYIKGRIVACDNGLPLGGVSIRLSDSDTTASDYTLQTNAAGEYQLEVPAFKAFVLKAGKAGYRDSMAAFHFPADVYSDTLYNPDLCLTPVPVPPVADTPSQVFNTVYFDFDKYTLSAEAKQVLDEVIKTLNSSPKLVIEINGHADEKGTDVYNYGLSMKRAQACFDYLVKKGIKVARLQVKASGESAPVAPNILDGKDNPEGRKLNRRAEFTIQR
jgi:OOP family OmpA-OmpF porin